MSNLSKRTKVIIGVVVGLIVLWAIWYFAFSKPAAVANATKAATDAAAAGAAAATAAAVSAAAGTTGTAEGM